MQFVFSTMILSELYSHYPMAVFSDSYTGYLITSETPEAVASDQFVGYFTKGNVDYRSTSLAFYLVISCWLQLAKSGEVYHRVRRLKGYKMFGTSHRSGKLEGEKLLDAREVGLPQENAQIFDTMMRMLQKSMRRLQNQPDIVKDLDVALYLLEKVVGGKQFANTSSFISEDLSRNEIAQEAVSKSPLPQRNPQKRDSSFLRQPRKSSSLLQLDINGSFIQNDSPTKFRRSAFGDNNSTLQFDITLNPGKHASYLTSYNQAIKNCLVNIDSINFNIFELQRVSSGREFMILGYEIAVQNFLLEKCNVNKYTYINFLDGMARSYNEITIAPYHSRAHAADVLQALHVFMKEGGLQQLLQLTPIEHFGAIVAAMAHDVDHPGLSNGFLVNSKDEMALLYNDQSVLENHHVAQTFMLLREEELDILSHLEVIDYRKVREVIIKMVLATDMAVHAASMNMLKSITERIAQDPSRGSNGFSNNQFIHIEEELRTTHKLFLMGQALHFSDITNPCREWGVCSRWTDLLFREFFAQGDLERASNLPISFLMDKRITNIADSQVNFINFIIEPSFSEFGKLCKGVLQEVRPGPSRSLFTNMRQNKRTWESLKSVFEQYREQSAILDPELHLDSTLDIGSMHLSLDDAFFTYENYQARKKKRLQMQAEAAGPAIEASSRRKQSVGKNQKPESNQQEKAVGNQEALSPQSRGAKMQPKSLSSQAVVGAADSTTQQQLLIPKPQKEELPGTHRDGSSRKNRRLTKDINDSTLRTDSDGTGNMQLSGVAMSGSGKHVRKPQLSQGSAANESRQGDTPQKR